MLQNIYCDIFIDPMIDFGIMHKVSYSCLIIATYNKVKPVPTQKLESL